MQGAEQPLQPQKQWTNVLSSALLRGKRMGGYGAFLLAVYNQEAEEFQSISKIGTGFSEEQLKQFYEQLKELTVPSPKPYYRCSSRLRRHKPCILSSNSADTPGVQFYTGHGSVYWAAGSCSSISWMAIKSLVLYRMSEEEI